MEELPTESDSRNGSSMAETHQLINNVPVDSFLLQKNKTSNFSIEYIMKKNNK